MTEETKEMLIPVTRLKAGSTSESILVEWVAGEEAHRGFIPAKKLLGSSEVAEKVLAAATPYGIPWGRLVSFSATPEKLEKLLHDAGIWTFQDLLEKAPAAIGAIQTAYAVDLGALVQAAIKYQEGGEA